MSGVFAGSIAQFLASPADLVKVHIQMEGKRRLMGEPPRYTLISQISMKSGQTDKKNWAYSSLFIFFFNFSRFCTQNHTLKDCLPCRSSDRAVTARSDLL